VVPWFLGTRTNLWSPDSDFLTTEYTEHTEGNPCTVMPCFRVFGLVCGSLVFGDKNQSVVAGLGRFLNHGTHRTHGRESSHGYASFPCIQVVLWFPGFRGQEPIRGRWTGTFFKPRNTRNTRKGILARSCLVSVYSGCSVVPWFSGRSVDPMPIQSRRNPLGNGDGEVQSLQAIGLGGCNRLP